MLIALLSSYSVSEGSLSLSKISPKPFDEIILQSERLASSHEVGSILKKDQELMIMVKDQLKNLLFSREDYEKKRKG